MDSASSTIPTQHTINTPYMVGPVHCYSARMNGELVLFDTGPPTEEAKRYLRENLPLHELKHVVVTHSHIDHYGLACWLDEETDAQIYFPYRDCLKITHHKERMSGMFRLLSRYGFMESDLLTLRRIFESGTLFPPFPEKFLPVEEALPQSLGIEVIPCPGHSQSDLVYAGRDWAITGDTLLRGIFQSPLLDLDLEHEGRFNNYRAYCTSIVRLAGLEGRTILPGHRNSVPSSLAVLQFYLSKLLTRVGQLREYRDEENLVRLMDGLLGGRKMDVFHMYLKVSEIVFMKDLLKEPELLHNALSETGLLGAVEELFDAAMK